MTGKIEFVAALMCDDIRHEADGGMSLMGVSSPDFLVTGFPSRKRMDFGLIVNTTSVGVVEFTTTLRWRDEVRWESEHKMEISDLGKGVLIPIDGTLAGFDQPGVLQLAIEYNGETHILQSWNVEGPSIDASEDED